jgi:serine/threonine protein kinase
VFKYFFLYQHMSFIWHEVGVWVRLPKHPNIVPFDKVVVDELEGRLVGFTTPFIPGGTVDENKDRPFKLKWLKQLMGVVDYMNLDLGVAHQDISPWNLLVDEATDSILLFDFNMSARLEKDRTPSIKTTSRGSCWRCTRS